MYRCHVRGVDERWWSPCPAYGVGGGVETRIVWLVCEMDGGPYVVIFDIWIYVWLEGCVTGLPECGLGCGYDLACGSV